MFWNKKRYKLNDAVNILEGLTDEEIRKIITTTTEVNVAKPLISHVLKMVYYVSRINWTCNFHAGQPMQYSLDI